MVTVDEHLTHSRQIDDQSAIAGAEARKTVSPAADSGKQACGASGANCSLHIRKVGASGDESGRAGRHAVPDATGAGIFGIGRPHQVTTESTFQRRKRFLDGCGHCYRSRSL
jgi:hypothetical protein